MSSQNEVSVVSTRRTHTLHTTVLAPASCTGLRHHGSLRTPAHAASRWCDDRHNYATASTYIVAPPAPRGTHALSLLCSENVWGAVWGDVLRHVWGVLCYVTCVGALCYVTCGGGAVLRHVWGAVLRHVWGAVLRHV